MAGGAMATDLRAWGSATPGWTDQAAGVGGWSVTSSGTPGPAAALWRSARVSVGATATEPAPGASASADSTAAETGEGETAVARSAVAETAGAETAEAETAVAETAVVETVSLETVSTALRNSCSNWLEADWKPLRVLPRVLPSSGRRLGPNTSRPMAAITAISGRPIPKIFIVSRHRWVDPALTRPGQWSNNQGPGRAWNPI